MPHILQWSCTEYEQGWHQHQTCLLPDQGRPLPGRKQQYLQPRPDLGGIYRRVSFKPGLLPPPQPKNRHKKMAKYLLNSDRIEPPLNREILQDQAHKRQMKEERTGHRGPCVVQSRALRGGGRTLGAVPTELRMLQAQDQGQVLRIAVISKPAECVDVSAHRVNQDLWQA